VPGCNSCRGWRLETTSIVAGRRRALVPQSESSCPQRHRSHATRPCHLSVLLSSVHQYPLVRGVIQPQEQSRHAYLDIAVHRACTLSPRTPRHCSEEVGAGDSLADIETDKAVMSFDSSEDGSEDGYVAKFLVPAGTAATVGVPVVVMCEEESDPDYELDNHR
jgi:hypothetical protein